MSKLILLSKAEAARLVGMTKQQFHYYDRVERVPGLMIIGCRKFYNKALLKGWKPVYKKRTTKKPKGEKK